MYMHARTFKRYRAEPAHTALRGTIKGKAKGKRLSQAARIVQQRIRKERREWATLFRAMRAARIEETMEHVARPRHRDAPKVRLRSPVADRPTISVASSAATRPRPASPASSSLTREEMARRLEVLGRVRCGV
jgi:hypothetical protein